MQRMTTWLAMVLVGCLFPVSGLALGNLENPADGGADSGVAPISGWVCDAGKVEIELAADCKLANGTRLVEAAYGLTRADTQGVCGDTNNGFVFLFNYGNCAAGEHTFRALADGVEFDRSTFYVTTFGTSFLRDADSLAPATVVQMVGMDADVYEVLVEWQQSKQNFVIVETEKMPFTLSQFLGAALGPWSGTWRSLAASGSVSFTFEVTPAMALGISDFTMTGTGCAANAQSTTDMGNIDLPITEATMTDGSVVIVHFYPTENLLMSGGNFWFESGPCAGLEGVLTTSRVMSM